MSLFHLHSWRIFSLDTEFWADSLFFHHFQMLLCSFLVMWFLVTVIWITVFFYVLYYYFLAFFNIKKIFCLLQFDYDAFGRWFLRDYTLWGLLRFLCLLNFCLEPYSGSFQPLFQIFIFFSNTNVFSLFGTPVYEC